MKTAKQAVATMKRHHDGGVTGFQGWCLKTVREAWGAPAKYPSAIVAWKAIPSSKKHTAPGRAPVGALHFFEIGEFGHVVMQSEKAGMVWGTDAPTKDKVGLVDINWFAKHWRAKYLGWSTHVNGVDLPCTEKPKATVKSVILGVTAKAIPTKNPASQYDHVAAAKGGGVDTVAPAKKTAARKPSAKKTAAKPATKPATKKAAAKPVAKMATPKKPTSKNK